MVRLQNKTNGIIATALFLLLLSSGAMPFLQVRHTHAASIQTLGAGAVRLDVGENPPGDGSGDNQTSAGHGVENDTDRLQDDSHNLNGTDSLHFALVPVNSSVSGTGHAKIGFDGLNLNVRAEFEGAGNGTTYTLVLTINGTGHSLGTAQTDGEDGGGEIEAEYALNSSGTYMFSVSLHVKSSAVLVSSPANQTATVTNSTSNEGGRGDNNQGDEQQGNWTGDSGGDGNWTGDGGQSGNWTGGGDQGGNWSSEGDTAVSIGQFGLNQLQAAQAAGQIPGVVVFSRSMPQVQVTDNRFSLSAGTLLGNGLLIQIAGRNVVGSRVLMVNLANAINLASQRLVIMLDGIRIPQASSLSQVLQASGKPSYLLTSTEAGLSLLVSIPQFLSVHTISLLPIASAAAQGLFQVSGITLLVSMATIGAAVLTAYKTRKVYIPAV